MAMNINSDERYAKGVEALKHPSMKQRPEVRRELFTQLKAYKTKKDVNTFNGMIDTTPRAFEQREQAQPLRSAGGTLGMGNAIASTAERTNKRDQLLSDMGVDIHKGMPAGKRFKAGLLDMDEESKVNALGHFAQQGFEEAGVKVPEGVPLIQRAAGGDIVYLRPVEQDDGSHKIERALVNGRGADWGDAARVGTEAAAMIPEIGAEIAGAIGGGAAGAAVVGTGVPVAGAIPGAATGAYLGATAGSAVGNAAANKMRLMLAKKLGIPDEALATYTTDKIMKMAGISAAMNAIPIAGDALIRGARNHGRFLRYETKADKDEAIRQVIEVADAVKTLEDVSGKKFVLNAAQVTGDPELAVVAKTQQPRIFGDMAHSMNVAEYQNKLNTVNALDAITHKREAIDFYGMNPEEIMAKAERVAQRAQVAVKAPLKRLDDLAEIAGKETDELMDTVDDFSRHNRGWTGLQRNTERQIDLAQDYEDQAWGLWRKQTGLDPETGKTQFMQYNAPDSEVSEYFGKLPQKAQQAMSKTAARADRKLADDLGVAGANQKEGVMAEVWDPNRSHELLSVLKGERRAMKTGPGELGWDAGTLSEAIKVLDRQVRNSQWVDTATGKMATAEKSIQLNHAFDEASTATRRKHDIFGDKALREMVDRTPDGSDFARQPGEVKGKLLAPNKASLLARTLDANDNSLEVRRLLGDELDIMYKQTVVDSKGKINPQSHAKFVQAYQDHVQLIYGKDASEFMTTANSLAVRNKGLESTRKKTEKALKHAFGSKLAGEQLYAGNVATDLFKSKVAPKHINALHARLMSQGEEGLKLWDDIVQQGRDDLREEFVKEGARMGNSGKINKFLHQHGNRARAMYGDEYVENLKALRTVLYALEGTSAKGVKREAQPVWMHITRTSFGALSDAQRRISAAHRFARKRNDQRLSRLLTHPEMLDKLMKINPANPERIAKIFALATLSQPGKDAAMNSAEIYERLRGELTEEEQMLALEYAHLHEEEN